MAKLSTPRGAQAGYLRWLLVGNPFAHLSSEGLDEISSYHVPTEVDRKLLEIVERALHEGVQEIVVLVGEFGSGKTQRLRYVAERIDYADRIYAKIDSDDWVDVAKSILIAIRSSLLDKLLIRKIDEATLSDPLPVAKQVAAALNARDKVILMLDEIENVLLGTKKDAVAFAKFLKALYERLDGGKVILIACVPKAINVIGSVLNSLGARILRVGPITPREASEIIRRRMSKYRIEGVRSPNPYYPLTERIILKIAEKARYNPREMIRIARTVLSHVTVGEGGQIAIDEKQMLGLLGAREEQRKEDSVPKQLIELYKSSGPFTLREASRALGKGIVETLSIIRRLERAGLVERNSSGRYVLIGH